MLMLVLVALVALVAGHGIAGVVAEDGPQPTTIAQPAHQQVGNASFRVVEDGTFHINTTGAVVVNGVDVVQRINELTTMVNEVRDYLMLPELLAEANPGKHLIVFEGTVRAGTKDLTSLSFGQRIVRVPGAIDLGVNDLTSIDFGALEVVGGAFEITRNPFRTFSFQNIRYVGGNIRLDDMELEEVDFGALTFVGGDILMNNNPVVVADMSRIERVGSLTAYQTKLRAANFTGLRSVNSINMHKCELEAVAFGPHLTQIGLSAYFHQNQITSVDFGGVQSIHSVLYLYSNNLTALDFGSMTHIGGKIYVHDNPDLATLDCKGLGSCICADSTTTLTNCPPPCPGACD